jgi:tetratricopeptide (TPR) repeat protein
VTDGEDGMKSGVKLGLAAATALWLSASPGAWAMMDTNNASPGDADYAAAVMAVNNHNYADAVSLLMKVVGRDPKNADAWNGLGFASRKLGKYADALGYYEKALAINPEHLGANEYLGELYLETGDLPKAQERLAKLDKLCPSGCQEYRDLKAAIAAKRGS